MLNNSLLDTEWTIIHLIGKKQSGKDTICNMLLEKLPKAVRIAYADPIKDIISITLDIPVEELEVYKNTTYGRGILQRFGTEAMKKYFGNEVWLNLLYGRLYRLADEYKFIIITDTRFDWEILPNSIKVKVISDRPVEDNTSGHISEHGISPNTIYDYTVNNSGTLEELDEVVDKLATLILNKV